MSTLLRLIPILLVISLVLSGAAAPAPTPTPAAQMGADHPPHPVGNDGWPDGYAALINGKQRVHGYWVNWYDQFFLAGSTTQLNTFIKRCSEFDAVRLEVVIHPGRCPVTSPWNPTPLDVKADWSSGTMPFTMNEAGDVIDKRFSITIDVWLGERIRLADLVIPKGATVKSGGEIEAFVKRHSARRQ